MLEMLFNIIKNINIKDLTNHQKFWVVLAVLLFVGFLWSWFAIKLILSLGLVLYCALLLGDIFKE